MQKGRNIVLMREQVRAIERARRVAADLRLGLIASQPEVVKERISDLAGEFLLRLAWSYSPRSSCCRFAWRQSQLWRLPLTVCATLAVINAIGVQLHQVSIAALIVARHRGGRRDRHRQRYLEFLDHRGARTNSWSRSAADVVVPVLTATLTIIASFVPLLILSGSTGKVIRPAVDGCFSSERFIHRNHATDPVPDFHQDKQGCTVLIAM
jgi:multidrug efflux pump subunit AcrB